MDWCSLKHGFYLHIVLRDLNENIFGNDRCQSAMTLGFVATPYKVDEDIDSRRKAR